MASSTQSSELAGYGPPESADGAHLEGYGPPEPIEDAKADVGPDARHALSIFGRPKFPEPKSDEELGLDEGPKFSREFPQFGSALRPIFGEVKGTIAKRAQDAPGTQAYASHHAGDEMNDPGAQLITGAALSAPLAAAGPSAIAPQVAGAAQAAMQGQDPVTGALLASAPGIPGTVRAADRAIGEAALNRVRPVGQGPGLGAKIAGKGVGALVGSTHGPLGIIVGQDIGGRAASLFSKAGDAATNALADRFLRQELASPAASARVANMVQLPSSTETIARPAQINLSPLVHEPLPPPTSVPNGALGTPFLDDFGVPVTRAGQGGFLPGEAATNAGARPAPAAKPKRLQILDENGRDLTSEPPSLREDVARDAKRFRDQPYDRDEPEPADVETQLARSVRMLSELKSAARAGKVSPLMIQDAIAAGMSPQAVAKTVGREAFEKATAR